MNKYDSICWHNDIDKLNMGGNDGSGINQGYHCCIGGLSMRRKGYINETFTTKMEGINAFGILNQKTVAKWNSLSPSNNADFDNDYSIRRNWRYNVTLRVNKDTFEQIKSDGTHLTRSKFISH